MPLLVTWLLGAALVLRIAVPMWQAMQGGASDAVLDPRAASSADSHEPDMAALRTLALFADPTAAPASSPAALNTALNLRLEGVILSGSGDNSMAVIVSGEQRDTYRRGDELPTGANVRIDSIARDHVVIDNRGQREVLWLFDGETPTSAAGVDSVTSITGAATGLTLPPGTDQRMLNTAARLAEIIRVAPEQANGRLIGYRLTPGARLKEFVQLGFETNDIVTAANGIALNDIANLPKLYGLMDGATEVSFSLLRNGMPMTLNVTLNPESAASQ